MSPQKKGKKAYLVRFEDDIDAWLVNLTKRNKVDNPMSRDGVATEIHSIVRKAFEEDTKSN